MTGPPSDLDAVGKVAEAFLARYRRGERPSLTEYTDKYPELAEQIRELFPALVVMEELGSVEGSAPGAPPGPVGAAGRLPEQLGDYRILRVAGRGGMGVVYEAVQLSLGRHVALKVLAGHGPLSPTQLERFRREARAAAKLHHTNIVPVHGVGEHDGIHYFAMQFIAGQALDEVLKEVARLRGKRDTPPPQGGGGGPGPSQSLAQGLLGGPSPSPGSQPPGPGGCPAGPASGAELTSQPEAQYFRSVARMGVQVADALDHAHRQGVLHRDIKPSNLLLDAGGTVWITDFGLAKAEDSDELTHTGDIVGTLRYMAPERFHGWSDARSDVYSLGVTLYELLTLRPAFEDSSRPRLIERITGEDPPRPRKVDRSIPRDLETIVLKAIDKEPGRRYQAAGDLAEDLRRFLLGEPVRARRVGPGERALKWVRRRPAVAALLAVSAAAVLALAAGAVVHNVQLAGALRDARDNLDKARRAEGQAQLAEREKTRQLAIARLREAQAENARAESQKAQRKAEAVTEYLVKLFRSSDPRVDGRDVKVADLSDHALADLEANFADSPKLRGDLLATLGKTYQGLRLYAKAAGLFEKALALRRVTLGADHPDTLDLMADLAHAYRGAGRPDKGVRLAEKTLMLQRAKLGADHHDTLRTVSFLGDAYRAASRPDEAIRLLEPSLRLCRRKLGSEDEVTLDTMNNLGLAYLWADRLPEAVALLRETLNSMKAKLGADGFETLNTTNNLAEALTASARPALAIPMLEESLPRCKTKLGPDHPITVTGRNNLADAYEAAAQPTKAEPLRVESVALTRRQHGNEESVELAEALSWLGRNYVLQKKYTEAEPILRECLAIRAKKMPDSWLFFNAKSLLGGSLLGQKKYADAGPLLLAGYEEMMQRADKIPAPCRPRLTEALQRLAQLFEAAGEMDKADKWRKKW
jgi:serine/threonine protein kinase/TolA-binding protein